MTSAYLLVILLNGQPIDYPAVLSTLGKCEALRHDVVAIVSGTEPARAARMSGGAIRLMEGGTPDNRAHAARG